MQETSIAIIYIVVSMSNHNGKLDIDGKLVFYDYDIYIYIDSM